MSSPDRMKKGIARKGKLSNPVNIRWEMSPTDIPFWSRKTRLEAPRLKEMGMPINMNTTKAMIVTTMFASYFASGWASVAGYPPSRCMVFTIAIRKAPTVTEKYGTTIGISMALDF
jgi:hypothetical protein